MNHQLRQPIAARLAIFALAALTFGPGALAAGSAADGLLYYSEDGRVVITNTPSRPDVRPVPGLGPVYGRVLRGVSLPATIYDPFIERVAAENGLTPELIKAVALVESAFDPHAVSPKGAQGLMQLMPATAKQYGVSDAFDPLQNLRAGATHLRRLLDEFDGDLTLALAAYNAGSGAVRRHGGVPNYRETREYVDKVRGRLGHTSRVTSSSRVAKGPAVRVVTAADGTLSFVN